MDYVGRELVAKIDELRSVLDKRDLGSLARRTIELEANSHSDQMEHAAVSYVVKKRCGTKENKTRPMRASELRRYTHATLCKTLQALNQTWDWAVGQYDGTLNSEFIQDIAYKIEPASWGYRRSNVMVTGQDIVMPPRWEKVRNQMEDLIMSCNDTTRHPIDRAIEAHLHIARIHPFMDGNGRTARLVQNLILHNHQYAPPIIRTNERLAYQILLRSAMVGYRERTSDGKIHTEPTAQEIVFFDHLAYNAYQSLKQAIGDTDPQSAYVINLRYKERSQVHATKKILDSYLRTNRLGIASLQDAKTGRISVRGRISKSQLEQTLSRCPTNGYTILPK